MKIIDNTTSAQPQVRHSACLSSLDCPSTFISFVCAVKIHKNKMMNKTQPALRDLHIMDGVYFNGLLFNVSKLRKNEMSTFFWWQFLLLTLILISDNYFSLLASTPSTNACLLMSSVVDAKLA